MNNNPSSNNPEIYISRNLRELRKYNKFTIEQVAEKIGVTRQAVAKWENGDSVPDVVNCLALANFYGVSLDELIHHNTEEAGYGIPPKDKYIFGITKIGERGQIVLPKEARDVFKIKKGDSFVVLGNEDPESYGLALVPTELFAGFADEMMKKLKDEPEKGA